MPVTCIKCNKSIKRNNDSEVINCISCKSTFHRDCIEFKSETSSVDLENYTCKNCSPDKGFELIKPTISKMRQDIQSLVSKQKEFTKTMESISSSLTILDSLEGKVSNNSENIEKIESEIAKLKSNMEYYEIKRREKNVVITGVPIRSAESVTNIVLKLAEIMKIELSKDSVEKCCRFQAKSGGIKPILVVFNTLHAKSLFLTAYRMKKKISAIDMGYTGTSTIHIGEHFTSNTHTLLQLARDKLINSGKYKYLWFQNSTILVRGEGDGKIRKIKCEADILRLINS